MEQKQSNFSGVPVLPIILGVGAVGLVYLGGSAIGKKFGIIKDPAQTAAITALSRIPELDPKFMAALPAGTVSMILTMKDRDALAKQIYESKGLFKDNKDLFWLSTKALKFKSQLAVLAETFAKQQGKDLASFLGTLLTSDEIARFIDLINSLPSGITPKA